MDLKSKILLITLGILVVLSICATFYKTVVLEDFEVFESEEANEELEEISE